MSEYGTYTTLVKTADGKWWDLGKREYPPVHPDCKTACSECLVVNAWTERISE